MQKKKIAIVGSGFLGMTLAMRLADAGAKVTLYESASAIGGLASVWEIADLIWDKHYHVILGSDKYTCDLIDELGLGDEMRWVETKTGFYTDGELLSMSDTMEFLKFPPLSLFSKFRLGLTILYASRLKDWKTLEKLTVTEWLTKWSGRQTFEKIWKPLLKAKLGNAYTQTAASFIWASIQRMYSARNSGMKKEMFGYVRGGYANVLERFSEVLLEKGVEIRLNSKVRSIQKIAPDRIRIETAADRRRGDVKSNLIRPQGTKYAKFQAAAAVAPGFSGGFLYEPDFDSRSISQSVSNIADFDKVIVTSPSNAAAKMIDGLSDAEKSMMENIRYQGIVCASLLLRCSLSNYYVTNITDDTPFTGIIEMSAIVDKKEFNHNALVYLPRYVAPDDELFDKPDEEIERIFLTGLEKMYPNFRREDVVAFKVSKVRQVFPIPTLRYSEGLAPMNTSVDGVYVVNSSHIVNGTLNINETVQLAERAFGELDLLN